MTYVSKTREELEMLAQDIVAGRVFHSAQCEDASILRMVFMPLALASADLFEQMRADKIASFYEYMSEAGPRSINGYPSFFSVKTLDAHDTQLLAEFMISINAQLEGRVSVARAGLEPSAEVKMPTSVAEAELMQKLGYMYLQQHAPERLETAYQRKLEALRFYADPQNWLGATIQLDSGEQQLEGTSEIALDAGKRAQEALG